jgi:hypothetical protein
MNLKKWLIGGIIIIFYLFSIFIFTQIYWNKFNTNTYDFKIEKEFNFDLFDYKTKPYIIGTDEPSGCNKYDYDAYASLLYRDNVEGLEKLRNSMIEEYANISWELMKENEDYQQIINKYSQMPLKNCTDRAPSMEHPGVYDMECHMYNQEITNPLNGAKQKIALNNLDIEQHSDMCINLTLKYVEDLSNEKRRELLDWGDFFYYTTLMSIAQDDPMIKASSTDIRNFNLGEFIITGLLLTSLISILGYKFDKKRNNKGGKMKNIKSQIKSIMFMLFSRINYKEECKKRGIKEEDLKKISELHNKYSLKWVSAILTIFVVIFIINLLNGYNILNPFNQGLKNLQWMSIIFGFFAAFFVSLNAFASKEQIALETATLFGKNDILQESIIKQKYAYRWGLYFLVFSIFLQLLYVLFS